jgi:hypothetical protein
LLGWKDISLKIQHKLQFTFNIKVGSMLLTECCLCYNSLLLTAQLLLL